MPDDFNLAIFRCRSASLQRLAIRKRTPSLLSSDDSARPLVLPVTVEFSDVTALCASGQREKRPQFR